MSETIKSDNSKINAKLLEQNKKLVEMVKALRETILCVPHYGRNITDKAQALLTEITNG
jgi:hypothetical protein